MVAGSRASVTRCTRTTLLVETAAGIQRIVARRSWPGSLSLEPAAPTPWCCRARTDRRAVAGRRARRAAHAAVSDISGGTLLTTIACIRDQLTTGKAQESFPGARRRSSAHWRVISVVCAQSEGSEFGQRCGAARAQTIAPSDMKPRKPFAGSQRSEPHRLPRRLTTAARYEANPRLASTMAESAAQSTK
jgi:hypothetical protein